MNKRNEPLQRDGSGDDSGSGPFPSSRGSNPDGPGAGTNGNGNGESRRRRAESNEARDKPIPPGEESQSKPKRKVHRLKISATEDFNAKLRKRGVVYLSRVPPRMGPARVKTLLSDFGTVTRVYLVEEDKTVRKKRRKAGGSSGKRYTEGWVEFESKKAAKMVGESLNMTKVSNYKGSIHFDDLWNVKYLGGFKWSHLTEKVAYERRVREQKLRVEMMEARRENASYVAQVEAGKKLDYIEERRKKRMTKAGSSGGAENDGEPLIKKRKVRQKRPLEGDKRATKSAILASLV